MPAKVKPVTVAMKNKLLAAAKALAIKAPDVGKGAGKSYEAWILLEIAAGLQAAGQVVQPKDHAGSTTTAFRVSAGPQFLSSAASKATDEPCYFEFQRKWQAYELHSGLRHCGISGDTHELDISVLSKSDADAVRKAGGGPPQGRVWLGIELKEYDSDAHLPKVFSRALLGTAVDLDPAFIVGNISIEFSRSISVFRHRPRANYWLATSAKLRPSHVKFLTNYGIKSRDTISPRNPGNLVPSVVTTLIDECW